MASVQTTILRNKKRTTFNTALLLENDLWKVDYSQTQMNIAMSPFGEILQNLENLGGFFTQQLVQQLPGMQKEMIRHLPQIQQEMERHLPQIQKDMQSLGDGLRKQIEQFGRTLPQPNAQQLPNSKPNSF